MRISHVNFGSRWLKKYQSPEQTMFEAYAKHCSRFNPPSRAKGPDFQKQARLDAGLDEDFIRSLQAWKRDD